MSSILIVGAGPTGLTLALDLLKRGHKIRIIEKLESINMRSRAIGVHAGTLEALEAAFGNSLTNKLIKIGNPTKAANFYFNEKPPIRVDLSVIPSRYNFMLILEQFHMENMILDELKRYGGEVEYRTELNTLVDASNEVICEIKRHNEQIEKCSFTLVIGCDGSHSATRRAANIDFLGDQYQGNFILADAIVDWPATPNESHIFSNANGVMACFPFQEKNKFRLTPILRNESIMKREAPLTKNDLQEIVNTLCPLKAKIQHVDWLTRFRLHHRLAKNFFKNRIILAGDAAHIHSPAGGQGLNTGIQDALNLSHKIDQTFSGSNYHKMMEKYESERMTQARKIVNGTDKAFRLAIMPENFKSRIMRRWVLPFIINFKFVQRTLVTLMSQISAARKEMNGRVY